MAQHEAVFFAHYASLVDFVRQYAGHQTKDTTYTLYEAAPVQAHEDTPALAWWLSAGLVSMLHRRPEQRATLQVEGDSLRADAQGLHPRWRVTATRSGESLLDLVGPQPWEQAEAPLHALFWCRDEPSFQRLIRDNLALGCDRLQHATLREPEGGQEVWLLRAERPSFFAIDAAQVSDQVQVYQPQTHLGLYCPWGSQHPLGELVSQGLGRDDLLLFQGLGAHTRALRLEAPAWQDVYQLMEFTLADLDSEQTWSNRSEQARHFEVQLRLAPSHKMREASLWVLPGSEQHHLERLLHAIPEPDLDSLQFTLQEDDQGERFVLIRERHMGHGREYIDFEGVRLAPYAGYPNLLLPVDAELEPLLRKDRYRALFGLQHGRLTLLWRHEERLRLVHVAERGFRPLTEMVDYLIGVGARDLEQIMARAVFDFQEYRHAAPMLESRPQKKRPPKADAQQEEPEELLEDEPQQQAPTQEEAPEQAPELAPRPEQVEEEPLSELEQREAELETQIITEGQSVERWSQLAQTKRKLGKVEEEALCWLEALWLTDPGDAAQALEQRALAALERSPEIGLAGLAVAERTSRLGALVRSGEKNPGAAWLWVVHGARHLRHKPQDQGMQGWLSQGHALLERYSESLRKKERWYLWGQLLTQNQDKVAEVRVRETLTEELNQRGLRPGEVPSFIANRIYQSRLLDEIDEDTSDELRAAMGILEHIEDTLRRSNEESVQRLSQAILAYGYERLGDKARSHERFEAAEGIYNDAASLKSSDRAWISLYLGATCELRSPGSGVNWLDVFQQLFKASTNDGLNHSELNTLQESLLRRASAESPTSFLSPENFRSLFPEPQKYVRAQAIKAELEQLIQQGEFNRTLQRLQDMGQQVSRRSDALGLQSRAQAWLLGYIVSALRRTGHAAEGVEILHNFEAGAPDPSTDPMSGFYPILYRIKLGEGFMDVGEEKHGMDLVCQSVRMAWTAEKPLQWLDHLDMLSAALQAIESAPMEHRLEGVEQVLEAMFLDRPHPSGLDGPAYRAIKLRLLDHCVEVGLSKEKLSLRRYKHYLDEDEFYIRQRIVNEKFTS